MQFQAQLIRQKSRRHAIINQSRADIAQLLQIGNLNIALARVSSVEVNILSVHSNLVRRLFCYHHTLQLFFTYFFSVIAFGFWHPYCPPSKFRLNGSTRTHVYWMHMIKLRISVNASSPTCPTLANAGTTYVRLSFFNLYARLSNTLLQFCVQLAHKCCCSRSKSDICCIKMWWIVTTASDKILVQREIWLGIWHYKCRTVCWEFCGLSVDQKP